METAEARNYRKTGEITEVKGDAGTSVLGMEGGFTGDKIPHGYVEIV